MTDRPIPESVRAKASKWTAKCYQPKTGTWFDVRDVIAEAIMEAEEAATARERERAAKIASSRAAKASIEANTRCIEDALQAAAVETAALSIAAAIRAEG